MLFLGTGAAELFPNPYCDCDVCQRARREGAIPRKRSALLMDETTMVDFGPDVMAASQMYDAPLSKVQDVFITHTHEDHFSIANIEAMTMADFRKGHFPIRFYLSEKGYAWLQRYRQAVETVGMRGFSRLEEKGRLELKPVKPYAWFEAAGMRVFAIESNHRANEGELAINYLFDRGEKGKLLYACDTGLYEAHNLEALKGQQADMLIMEGTMGNIQLDKSNGHMNAEHFVEQVENLMAAGALKEDARIFVTHINQVQSFSHAEYQQYLSRNSKANIVVAYDGMRV